MKINDNDIIDYVKSNPKLYKELMQKAAARKYEQARIRVLECTSACKYLSEAKAEVDKQISALTADYKRICVELYEASKELAKAKAICDECE